MINKVCFIPFRHCNLTNSSFLKWKEESLVKFALNITHTNLVRNLNNTYWCLESERNKVLYELGGWGVAVDTELHVRVGLKSKAQGWKAEKQPSKLLRSLILILATWELPNLLLDLKISSPHGHGGLIKCFQNLHNFSPPSLIFSDKRRQSPSAKPDIANLHPSLRPKILHWESSLIPLNRGRWSSLKHSCRSKILPHLALQEKLSHKQNGF